MQLLKLEQRLNISSALPSNTRQHNEPKLSPGELEATRSFWDAQYEYVDEVRIEHFPLKIRRDLDGEGPKAKTSILNQNDFVVIARP